MPAPARRQRSRGLPSVTDPPPLRAEHVSAGIPAASAGCRAGAGTHVAGSAGSTNSWGCAEGSRQSRMCRALCAVPETPRSQPVLQRRVDTG